MYGHAVHDGNPCTAVGLIMHFICLNNPFCSRTILLVWFKLQKFFSLNWTPVILAHHNRRLPDFTFECLMSPGGPYLYASLLRLCFTDQHLKWVLGCRTTSVGGLFPSHRARHASGYKNTVSGPCGGTHLSCVLQITVLTN